MVGVGEDVMVRIGKVGYGTHLFIATGNVKAILGRPFLFTTNARIEYIEVKRKSFLRELSLTIKYQPSEPVL